MESSKSIEFFAILSDSFKLLPKNGKLMAFVALSSAVLYASFVFLLSSSLQSLSLDIVATFMPDPSSFDPNSFNSTDPSSFTPSTGQITHLLHHLRRDIAFILAVEAAFLAAVSIISFFSAISTISISALSYNARTVSLKDLSSMICRSWTRPLITSLYVSAFSVGFFSAIGIFCAPLWMYPDLPTTWLAILIGTPSFVFYVYLLVPMILSVVISAVEEDCAGLEALGMAAALVKGKRLQGFLINVVFGVVALIISQFFRIKLLRTTVVLMAVMMVSWLVMILLWVVYTVFYFQCKVQHGDEILELNGSVQYTAVLDKDLP